jgi:alkylation response protein AidB-like acyl-CoA dehydrogenase
VDFTLDEEQQAVEELSGRVLRDATTMERLREIEDTGANGGTPDFDRKLWASLAEAGLLGVTIPEAQGGLGLGTVALAVLLEQVGRHVAPVPAIATLGFGVPALTEYGTPEQQQAILPGVQAGETILTAALVEANGDPLQPRTTARRSGDGWVLDGEKTCVPAGLWANYIVVSAATDDGSALFLVPSDASGLERERQDTVSYVPEALIRLSGVQVGADALLGGTDGSAVAGLVGHATVALSATAIGVCETAIKLTSDYVTSREQFGHALAAFQAVRQRIADSFIDTAAIRLTTMEAAWRLQEKLPADKEVAVAKLYASMGGRRVVRAAAHLHGGMGVDRTYPLHRYYVWAKQLELSLGSVSKQERILGKLLAEEALAGAGAA